MKWLWKWQKGQSPNIARNDSLPPDIQHAKIQKLVEGRKQASKMVRLVFTNLIPIDPIRWMVFRHDKKQNIRRLD